MAEIVGKNEQQIVVSEVLNIQTSDYLAEMQRRTGRKDHEMEQTYETVHDYLDTRTTRSKDVQSAEVNEARQIAAAYFDEPFQAVNGAACVSVDTSCMDVRTRRAIQTGIPARGGGGLGGGSMRFPAGKPAGVYSETQGGPLILDPNSPYAIEIGKTFSKALNVVQVFDSHAGCAAGNEEATGHTHISPDSGRMDDVMFKKNLIHTVEGYASSLGVENVVSIQTGFDPHTGFITLGLEKEENLAIAEVNGGYTPDVIQRLTDEKSILPLNTLAYTSLNSVFDNAKFDLDWKGNYAQSALNFWRNIEAIKPAALPVLIDEIRRIYPNESDLKIESMARLSLANSYSGWLLNMKGTYPFGDHNEDVVVALVGGEYGPFAKAESLEVFRDQPYLIPDSLLASRIVRSNREKGKAHGNISDPVPFVVKSRIKNGVSEHKESEDIQEFVHSFSAELKTLDWQNLGHHGIIEYIGDRHPHLSVGTASAVARLADTMARIHDPRDRHAPYIQRGSLMPTPILVSDNREPLGVLPFFPRHTH